MVIVITYLLGGYADGFYGYYSARPARCGTVIIRLGRLGVVQK